ncbi:putative transferase CAF17 homolog, mitochondrial [Callorhinchus milii]|nr:putative transferase CAF17 homolog, mitochondrial [Callorhinchus milii]
MLPLQLRRGPGLAAHRRRLLLLLMPPPPPPSPARRSSAAAAAAAAGPEPEAASPRYRCYALAHRALLGLGGRDTASFLQGLVTNDVELLLSGGTAAALYCHLLNVQGRSVFDSIMYRLHKNQDEEPAVLLECDVAMLEALQKHLKVYKIRRKVDLAPCPHLSLWSVLPSKQSKEAGGALEVDPRKVVTCTPDPRTEAMGWRLVLDKLENPLDIVPESQQGDIQDYHRHRYKIGIPEGVKDIVPGVALPLESNLVYMNGISFSKGCYIGQELTARTQHTGVIRKRLMPIKLKSAPPPGSIPDKAAIVSEAGKPAGSYKNSEGDVGLALIRLAQASEPLQMATTDGKRVSLSALVPGWWPNDEANKRNK